MIHPIQGIANTEGFKTGFCAIRESVSSDIMTSLADTKGTPLEALFQGIEDFTLNHLIKKSQEASLASQIEQIEKSIAAGSIDSNSIVQSLVEAKNAESQRLQDILAKREQTARLLSHFEEGFKDSPIESIEQKVKELPKTAQERKDLISDITNLRLAAVDNLAAIEDYSKRIDIGAQKAAIQRINLEAQAKQKAELAQKYYASVVEQHANKSAADSAKVFEESFTPQIVKRFNNAMTTIKEFAKKHKVLSAISIITPVALGVYLNRVKKQELIKQELK